MNELVSIIMPAYNASRYIGEAIDSVLAQTYTNWELIIVDDGSKDGTSQIVESYNDVRIKFFKNEKNLGVADTRNKAISLAKGNWIAFLDSDDMWMPEKLQKQLAFAKETGANFTFTGSAFINEQGNKSNYVLQVPEKLTIDELLKQNLISCSAVMIRKTLLSGKKMLNDHSLHEDYLLWLELLKEGNIAYGLNEPLLIYRMLKNSKTGNKRKSAVMTWNTYRAFGLGYVSSICNFAEYTKRSLKKYKGISIKSK